MGRRRRSTTLRVLLNGRLVGHLTREASGALRFTYDQSWLDWPHALPISLSLPLQEAPYRGAPVWAVIENLLPDSDALRRQVAEKVGAAGTDAHSLLAAIGADCVGALQFLRDDSAVTDQEEAGGVSGESVDDETIERLLRGLSQAPLGLTREDPFRISVAGVQEKTALLWCDGRWYRPRGTTPTTHLLKVQMGSLPNGLDLSSSVENEYYCLALARAFGLSAARADIRTFGATRALVIERFDRRWTRDGRLIRVPQEDCCQALSVPPTLKYQGDGGPGLVDILTLLKGSDDPMRDWETVLKAQAFFWLIGATDGHAKNFSIALRPGGRYELTPLYDILTAQPNADARKLERKQMKLAMSVGKRRRYRFADVMGRHFEQTAEEAGVPTQLVRKALEDLAARAPGAIEATADALPADFPFEIHESVADAIRQRAERLTTTLGR